MHKKYISCTQGRIRIDVLDGPKKYALFKDYDETYLPDNILRVINRISDQIFRVSIKNYDILAASYYDDFDIDEEELNHAVEEINSKIPFKYHPDVLYIDDYYDVHYDDYMYCNEVRNSLKDEIKNYIDNHIKGKYLENIFKSRTKDISYLLDTNIYDFEFNVRTYNALIRSNIYTLEDLLKLSYEDLLNMRHMNEKCCFNVLNKLSLFVYLFEELKQLDNNGYPLLSHVNTIDHIELNDNVLNSFLNILGFDLQTFFHVGLSKDIVEELLHRGILDIKQLVKCNKEIIDDLCDEHKYKVMALKDRYYHIAYISKDESLVEYVEKHNIRTYDDIKHIEDINMKNKFIDIINNINKYESNRHRYAIIVNGNIY